MTAALFAYHAEDVEEVIAAWLSPLRRSGSAYRVGDPLPFTLVTHIPSGTEDFYTQLAAPVVSVHTLCDKALGYQNAATEAQATHDRIALLAYELPDVTLPDGRTAAVDWVKPFQEPAWVDYQNVSILRKVARYSVGLSYVYVPSQDTGG